ncbi:hypothetical protein ACSTB0_13720, partial [Faecalibacterium wellingii]|uniref:hypothetical protein n=1 Tax=Faecalibacterium wellingii TaxID=2929491 RepID=UPI003EDACD0F
DALQALQQGLHIVDYNLHTTRYLLKETRIPAFQGNVTIEARLDGHIALKGWNARFFQQITCGMEIIIHNMKPLL